MLRRPARPSPALVRLGIAVALSTAAGVFLGLLGPFGSYRNGAAPERIAYFVGTFWVASLLYAVIVPAAAQAAARARLPLWLWAPPVMAATAVPVAAVSRVGAQSLWPWIGEQVGLLEWYGQSLTLSVAAVGAALLVRRSWSASGTGPSARVASADEPPAEASARPLARGEVLCLQMEDHYVRIHTPTGSRLELMSMSQAIAALGDVEGRRVHRSWWVARAAVEAAEPDGRNWRLRLRGGLRAPVSRANVAPLRAAGWLPPAAG
jgi:hypothetical protein